MMVVHSMGRYSNSETKRKEWEPCALSLMFFITPLTQSKTIDLKNTNRKTCACQMDLIVIHIRAAEINAREQGVKKNLKRIVRGGNE